MQTIYKNRNTLFRILTLFIAAVYGILICSHALGEDFVIQDDGRHHIFWMVRYVDAELLPNDLIADYFQSVAPVGYKFFYFAISKLGIKPIFLSQIIPIILGVLTSYLLYAFCLNIYNSPFFAFLTTTLMGQHLWMEDDLISGTPRAFVYPILLGFLLSFQENKFLWTVTALLLSGLFYPSLLLVLFGFLILEALLKRRKFFNEFGELFQYLKSKAQEPKVSNLFKYDVAKFGAYSLICIFVIIYYALKPSEFSPQIFLDAAWNMPEVFSGGRSKFFSSNFVSYFVTGSRSGLFSPTFYDPNTILVVYLFPIGYYLHLKNNHNNKRNINHSILLKPFLSAIVLFLLAHILLFRLYFPNRYTLHVTQLILCVYAGLTLQFILSALWSFKNKFAGIITKSFAIAIVAVFLAAPFVFADTFTVTKFEHGTHEELYLYLKQQPKDIMVSTLNGEGDNLSSFAHRSVLVSREQALPWHLGYYRQIRQRVTDSLKAHYTNDPKILESFVEQYDIDYFLISASEFTNREGFLGNKWLRQFEDGYYSALNSFDKYQPLIFKYRKACSTLQDQSLVLIKAQCILEKS